MFKREQDEVLASIEAWLRGRIPAVAITWGVTIVVLAGLVLLLYRPVSAAYEGIVSWWDAGLSAAIQDLEQAGTRKFLTSAESSVFPPPLSGPIPIRYSLATEQNVKVDRQNCSLTIKKTQMNEVARPDEPHQFTSKRTEDTFQLVRVNSLQFSDEKSRNSLPRDQDTNTVGLTLRNGEFSSTEQILESDKLPRFVRKTSISFEVYSRDFVKLGEQILLLLKRCGAREILYVDGVHAGWVTR